MKTINVPVTKREMSSKASAIRKAGEVPCVMYSAGQENVHFTAQLVSFKELLYTPGLKRAEITVDGKTHHALVKDAQYHPVTDRLEHVDFIELQAGRKIRADIPVRTTGRAMGEAEGGILYINVPYVKIKAMPEQLREFIEVDVTELDMNDSFRISDLSRQFPDYEFHHPETVSVISVETSRAARAAAAEEAAAAAAKAAAEAALPVEAEVAKPAEGAEAAPPKEGEEPKKEPGKEKE